jgi:hypothetical protein
MLKVLFEIVDDYFILLVRVDRLCIKTYLHVSSRLEMYTYKYD